MKRYIYFVGLALAFCVSQAGIAAPPVNCADLLKSARGEFPNRHYMPNGSSWDGTIAITRWYPCSQNMCFNGTIAISGTSFLNGIRGELNGSRFTMWRDVGSGDQIWTGTCVDRTVTGTWINHTTYNPRWTGNFDIWIP